MPDQPRLDLPDTTWPFGDLRRAHYAAILVDPPWRFRNYSTKGEKKNPVAHYTVMTIEEIKALPVADLAAPDCALTLWATAPLLPRAIEVMGAWGFAFKSAGSWAKQSRTGRKWGFGTGYIYRSATEFWLCGTRGSPRQQSRSIRNLIVSPLREHSRKPEQMRDDVETLWPGPYADLFSREPRDGWDVWGMEWWRFADPSVRP